MCGVSRDPVLAGRDLDPESFHKGLFSGTVGFSFHDDPGGSNGTVYRNEESKCYIFTYF